MLNRRGFFGRVAALAAGAAAAKALPVKPSPPVLDYKHQGFSGYYYAESTNEPLKLWFSNTHTLSTSAIEWVELDK